jgi:hypothetical protein
MNLELLSKENYGRSKPSVFTTHFRRKKRELFFSRSFRIKMSVARLASCLSKVDVPITSKTIRSICFLGLFLGLFIVSFCTSFTSFATSSVSSPSLGSNIVAATGSSCTVTITYENSHDNAIQHALNEATKGNISPFNICIGAGVFPEQLNITSRGGISLIGLGTPAKPSIIDPLSVVVNNYDFLGIPFAQAAIILAGNNGTSGTLRNINVRNLVIDGNGARVSINKYPVCYADFAGINYDGASGTIVNNTIANMYLPRSQASCADGGGIDVDINNNLSPAESVTIANNIIPNYGEFGIGCWGQSNSRLMTCTITNNDMWFYAKYASLSTGPAGIAILQNALATVTHNTISGNHCTQTTLAVPCGSNLIMQAQGSGIFTLGSGSGTIVNDNAVNDNDIGIQTVGDTASVLDNKVLNSKVAAIETIDGTGIYNVNGNCVFLSPLGIAVVNAGYFFGDTTTFTTRIISNSLFHSPIHLEIITLSPGKAIVYFQSEKYVVSGNATVQIR